VPLLGGLGVLAGLAAGLAAGWAIARLVGAPGPAALPPLFPALAWGGLVAGYALLGLCDDLAGLSPAARLGLETAGALVVLVALHPGPLPGGAGWVRVLATAAILVGGTNAFNLADNADGLAAGTGLLALAGCAAYLAPDPERTWAAAAALAGAGALGGFLVWNRPPARLYLGDGGALAAGVLLAALLVTAPRPPGSATGVLALPFLAGYLVVDPAYAILGRLARGAAPWRGGVDHLSHDLGAAMRGWPRAWRAILVVQVFSVVSALGVLRGVLPAWALAATACPWAVLWWAGTRGRRLRRMDAGRG
jgi:UDP-GlcNAc:undecaprenyl-phosphate GlcNAc-1-phosphate transferase